MFVRIYPKFHLTATWGPYWAHVRHAWERRSHPNLCILFYDKMKRNPKPEYRRLATFLGVNPTDERLENVSILVANVFKQSCSSQKSLINILVSIRFTSTIEYFEAYFNNVNYNMLFRLFVILASPKWNIETLTQSFEMIQQCWWLLMLQPPEVDFSEEVGSLPKRTFLWSYCSVILKKLINRPIIIVMLWELFKYEDISAKLYVCIEITFLYLCKPWWCCIFHT